MQKANARLCMLLACSVLALLLAVSVRCSIARAAEVPAQEQTVQVPIATWAELRSNNANLVWKLAQAEMQIKTLKQPSKELQLQLEDVKQQLQKSQEALMLSNSKLESAVDLQSEMKSSLQALNESIEAERARNKAVQRRIRRQRDAAYILALAAVALSR